MALRSHAPQVSDAEWDASVAALLELGRHAEALETLQRAIAQASGSRRFEELLGQLGQFPPALSDLPELLRLRLRLLGNLPQHQLQMKDELRSHLAAGREFPFLHVYLAWLHSEQEEDAGSLTQSEKVSDTDLAKLSPFERALLWRSRGRSLARLGKGGWAQAFARALDEVSGRPRLLTLLELAAVQARENEVARAMQTLSEARTLARGDCLELRVVEQLGLLCLRAGEFEDAERYFGQMERLSRRGDTKRLLSRALSSLATTRRALGEWKRAEQLYEQALRAAVQSGDEDDERYALRGIGHTRRLAGLPLGALEPLEQAARVVRADREEGRSFVKVDIAAAQVSLPHLDMQAVQTSLAQASKVSQEGRGRLTLVQAELARRTGDEAGARAHLGTLLPERQSLWLREEAHAFPGLFALLPPDQRPAPLPRPTRTVVCLHAIGIPRVMVNGREVTMPPLSVVALAALLEQEGQASTDTLAEVLRDSEPRSLRQAGQRVSKAVSTLRRALGWADSVQTRCRSYVLDPAADWHYDVAAARAAGRPVAAFLSGFDLPWVTDHEQYLSLKD